MVAPAPGGHNASSLLWGYPIAGVNTFFINSFQLKLESAIGFSLRTLEIWEIDKGMGYSGVESVALGS